MSADASARGTAIDRLAALPDRGKAPVSARVLETWVAQAQPRVGVDAGRLGWLIASTVVIAALQRDGLEKFYRPVEWMRYVIDHFLHPVRSRPAADCRASTVSRLTTRATAWWPAPDGTPARCF